MLLGKYREHPMKVFRIAIVIAMPALLVSPALVVSPAYAQAPSLNLMMDNKPPKSQEEKDAEAARDKAYKDSLRKIPDAKAPADPWGTVRSNDAPSKATASAKPKTKTGSTAN
jgi:hypothetical protein